MTTQPEPKRDLTWLEPRDQQERADALNRFDAALFGANVMARGLGCTTMDYESTIAMVRETARAERKRLLDELEAAG